MKKIIICIVTILTLFSCEKQSINSGYIVDKTYRARYIRTYYNISLKMVMSEIIPEKYEIVIATKDGISSKVVNQNIYNTVTLGQYIDLTK